MQQRFRPSKACRRYGQGSTRGAGQYAEHARERRPERLAGGKEGRRQSRPGTGRSQERGATPRLPAKGRRRGTERTRYRAQAGKVVGTEGELKRNPSSTA